jgi:hypothetical protein
MQTELLMNDLREISVVIGFFSNNMKPCQTAMAKAVVVSNGNSCQWWWLKSNLRAFSSF